MKQYKLTKDLKKGEVVELDEGLAKQMGGLVEEVKGGGWKPNVNEDYWKWILVYSIAACINENQDITDKDWAMGNCYRTREEAIRARDKQRDKQLALQELKDLAGHWKLDWSNGSRSKYYIRYDHYSECFRVSEVYAAYHCLDIYFETEEAAEHAIKTLGEVKLKLIFDIE